MKVELLSTTPDVAAPTSPADSNAFSKALEDIASVLDSATHAEDAFARGSGSLQEAVYQRARADVAIAVATSAAQRAVQALQSVMNMQI